MLMFTTTPLGQLRVGESSVTKSMPAMMAEVEPEPESERTLTPSNLVCLAAPWTSPPIIPAMCVPCPLPSVVVESTKLAICDARSPKSGWVASMPVSRMYAHVPEPDEVS